MEIKALSAYGFGPAVITSWEAEGHKALLPIQEKAILEGKVLEGKNVLVLSPTSSGKTFVAELAAVKAVQQKRQVIYLVPQKALAEEKFAEFRRKYAPLGINVVISTRDHQEFDEAIQTGEFDIAIAVFEKLQGLIVAHPQFLNRLGLVIVDELQMLSNRDRGGRLELLLTKIKLQATEAQIIGLSAVIGKGEELAPQGASPRFFPDDIVAWVRAGCPPAATFAQWNAAEEKRQKRAG